MKQEIIKDLHIIPRLEQVPYLVHGFGTKKWRQADFKTKSKLKDFDLIFLNQTHSDIIQHIDKIPDKKLKGDAMISSCPKLLLIIQTADCLPVLFVDELRKVIAAVHCGWRGTTKRLVQKVIQRMRDNYGCCPSSLLVALGPCLGRECYEVGEDVFQSYEQGRHSTEFFQNHPIRKNKYLFDLRGSNLSQMISCGVSKKNVYSIDFCTHCQKNLLSFRRDKEKTERMLSFIGMSF